LINGEKHADGGSAVAQAKRRRSLTDAFVRTARPKAKPYRVWDTRVPGLVLRIWPSGKKCFYVDYRCRGRRGFYSIGRYPIFGVAEAREIARGVLNRAAKGEDPAAEKQAQRGAALKEVHKRYLDEYAVKHNKSWQQGKFLIEKYILPRLGKLPVEGVTRTEVRAVFNSIEAPVLANQVLAATSAIFTWAAKQDLVTAPNPCKGIDRNPTRSRERKLSDTEVPLFWSALDDSIIAHRVLKAMWFTGQRGIEVRHMRWEHIVDGGWWMMPGEETRVWCGTKNKRNHQLWLPRAARAIIDGQRQGNVTPITGYVFADHGGRPVDHLDAVMRTICQRLGIRDRIKPHDLRRSHGSTITHLKLGRDAMDRIQNHVEGGVTDVYDRTEYAAEDKQIMEAVAEHIMALARGDGTAAVASR
jgi:integrase